MTTAVPQALESTLQKKHRTRSKTSEVIDEAAGANEFFSIAPPAILLDCTVSYSCE